MNRVTAALLVVALVGLATANPPAAVAPVAVAPAYGVGADPADLSAAVRELAAEVKALRVEMAAARAGAALPQKAAGKAPAAVAKAACAACHTPGKADDRGGGFALFADEKAGALAQLSARDRQRAAARIVSGSMPPAPKKLDASDRDTLVELFRK